MKKRIIITGSIVVGIILTGITLYGMVSILFKHSPEKELNRQVISLADFDYTIVSANDLDEEWYSLGSPEILVFNELTQSNIDYLKSCNPLPMPISEMEYRQMIPYKIPNPFKMPKSDYYIYQNGRIPKWEIYSIAGGPRREKALDFKVFIIDPEKKLGVLYKSNYKERTVY